MTLSFTMPESLEYNGVKVVLAAESSARVQNAINYLLAYGYDKSLQDAVAGLKKSMMEDGESSESIAIAIRDKMAGRAEAILAGTVGTRGPRLTGPDATRRTVLDEFFKTWCTKMAEKGKALPTLKSRFGVSAKDATDEQKKVIADEIAAIKAKYATLKATEIEEEVSRRLAMQSKQDDIDLDLDLDDATGEDEQGDDGEQAEDVE